MINQLQILVEVEKSLKILNSINFNKSNELKKHIENIRELQLQSFVENETYNFVLTDALKKEEQTRGNGASTFNEDVVRRR
jgi:hypothetical protein